MTATALMNTVAATGLGGVAGYVLHRVVGCRSGACPLWSRAWAATLYGAALGFLLGVR
jgi:Family of unknown function (DUF6132)